MSFSPVTLELARATMAARTRTARTGPVRSHSRSRRVPVWLAVITAVALLATACGSATAAAPAVSPVTEHEAVDMADRALQAFNDRDHAGWTADWSEAMRQAIDEQAFVEFRDEFHSALGDYVEIEGAEGRPGDDPGTYRWTFDVRFEQGGYRMWFGFREGSPLVEGIRFEEPPAAAGR